MEIGRLTYTLRNNYSSFAITNNYSLLCQCSNVRMLLLLLLQLLLLFSQLLWLPLPVNPTVSVIVAKRPCFCYYYSLPLILVLMQDAITTTTVTVTTHYCWQYHFAKQSYFSCCYVCFCSSHPFTASNAALSAIIEVQFYSIGCYHC